MKPKKKIAVMLLIIICSVFVLLMSSGGTFTAYESEVDNKTSVNLARWNILIDDQNITDTMVSDILVENVIWSNVKSNPEKLAPGSSGTMKFIIDPTTTQVSIRYDITFEDNTVDTDNILTVLGFSTSTGSLIRTAENTYTGVFSLNDINNDQTREISVELKWIDDEDNNDRDSAIGRGEIEDLSYCNFKFVATQYKGETIVPYS